MRGGIEKRAGGLPPGPDLTRARLTARIAMRPLAFLEEQRARFGDVFTLRAIDERPWVMVSDPELIAAVLRAPPDVLQAGAAKRRVLMPLLGENSLLLLDEERHAEQRRMLLPAFGGDRIAAQEEAMRGAAERAVAAGRIGGDVVAIDLTRAIALETILRAVFGPAAGKRLDRLREALRDLRLPGNSREGWTEAYRRAVAPVDELVLAEIGDRGVAPGGDAGDDVLSTLLAARGDDGSALSPLEIRDELMTMIIAGYETTATTLAWTLERLAHYPDALAAVEAEAPAGGGPHTEAAIKETLRLRPALPTVARAVEAPFQLGEHVLPPGVEIRLAVLLLHHRPDLHPAPYELRPERFLDRSPPPHTWLPFGGGPRRCIGARFALHEMRVVLAALLNRVIVRPAGPGAEPMRHRDITLTPARGARVILESR